MSFNIVHVFYLFVSLLHSVSGSFFFFFLFLGLLLLFGLGLFCERQGLAV
jgi:succinate dehydrogenase/fumarate reductase cytochrome b subunit